MLVSILKTVGYKLLFAAGWCLYWLAASGGERVPVGALLAGPAMMLTAMILLTRRRSRLQRLARAVPEGVSSWSGPVATQPIQSNGEVVKPSIRNRT